MQIRGCGCRSDVNEDLVRRSWMKTLLCRKIVVFLEEEEEEGKKKERRT
jgi:hypothetical protein